MVKATIMDDNNSYIEQLKRSFNKISLICSDGIEFVSPHQVIYFKSEGSYTSVVMENKKTLITKQLGIMGASLDNHLFFRPHRSYIININHIKKYVRNDGGYLIMSNDDKVDVSRRKKEQLLRLF